MKKTLYMKHVQEKPQGIEEKKHILMYVQGEDFDYKEVSEEFMEYYKWLLNGGFDLLSYQHYETFKCSRSKHSINDLIGEGIPKNISDEKKKKEKECYYNANSLILEYVLKKTFTKELYDRLDKEKSIGVKMRYKDILQRLMLDRSNLINEYNYYCNEDKSFLPQKQYIQSHGVHNVLRQSIYGEYSYHSFNDYEPGAGIAVVRQLIELRIKRAIGVIGYKTANGEEQPLFMRQILNVLKNHRIESELDIPSIDRVYSFANIYMHSGYILYSWHPIFFEYILRQFSFGDVDQFDKTGKWNINSGICLMESELDDIYKEILNNIKGAKELIVCKPECCFIDKNRG